MQVDPEAGHAPQAYSEYLARTGIRIGVEPFPRHVGLHRAFVIARDGVRHDLPIPLASDPAAMTQGDLLRWVQREAVGLLHMHEVPEAHDLGQAAIEAYVALAQAGQEPFHGDVVDGLLGAIRASVGDDDLRTLIVELGDAAEWNEGFEPSGMRPA